MSMRFIRPSTPLFNALVASPTVAQSTPFILQAISSAAVAWLINVGAGLTATFNIMVSMDGINYYDSGTILPSVSGSAKIFPVSYSGGFPYALIQITPSAGSGIVTITGAAKGNA